MENKILQSTYQIRFQDSDPFRHLNNARYLDYFVNAREDQFETSFGIKTGEMAFKDNLGWVVASNYISYLVPANVNEDILIESQILDFGNKHLKIEMRMWDINKTHIKALNWVNLVHFDIKTGRPKNHTEDLLTIFKSILFPVETIDFEERTSYFSSANKANRNIVS
jgi:acyl-CoA thioester hydrolase